MLPTWDKGNTIQVFQLSFIFSFKILLILLNVMPAVTLDNKIYFFWKNLLIVVSVYNKNMNTEKQVQYNVKIHESR